MSIKVISWVWDSSASRGTDRLVLLAIADSASGDDGTNAYPSIATLARKAGVSTRTVQRAIRTLVELGELEFSPGAGRNGSNLYRVNVRQIVTPVRLSPPRQSDTCQDDTPPVNLSRGGDNLSPTPCQDDTQSVLNPLGTKSARRTPFCDQHPNGTDDDCRKCARRRIAFERANRNATSNVTTIIDSKAKNCKACGGDGWITDREGKPLSKCHHPDPLAAARGW